MKKELPKAYEPSFYEDGIYKKWEEAGLFNPDNLVLPKNAPGYSIVMPPPNVTGTLHLGHAAMLALEDILIRYHRMRGERALWLPGTDHAAIATQTKVEKMLKEKGLNRHKLGRQKFLKEVEKFARESHNTIVKQVKKMGSSCDWSREAYTLDETRTRAVRTVFKMMHDDGLIYRGERIVNWCPRCHSTLADDEVEYRQQKAKFYTFKYSKDFPLAIATTRPETKLGDTAVAVNLKDKRYQKYIGKIYDADFAGVKVKLKIIADRQVDMNFGTGAVGVTPAHSAADWQMAEANNLKMVKVIDEDGKIHQGFNEYSGRGALEAREMIVKKLKEEGLLIKEEEIENNLSLCYRCYTAIEPLPSRQWFIDVNKKIPRYKKSVKELCLSAVKSGVFGRDKIRIIPERFEKNYFHWIENLRDWCISRQIWFGHQIPVWRRKFKIKNEKLREEIYVGAEAPAGEWERETDTLDTWFSSGLWTFSTLARAPEEIKVKNGKLIIDNKDFKKFHPTAVLETGYDILFFWVARMIIMTAYAAGDIPFRDVYLHGLVRDEKGRKMSKSLGNVIDPLDMIKKYGTDAVRLALVLGTGPGNDLNLSEEKIAGFRNFTNKLWNIARYIISNPPAMLTLPVRQAGRQAGFQFPVSSFQLNYKNCTLIDKWILAKTEKLIKEVSADLNNYRFSQAGEKLKDFTWNDLADWYLEASKFEKTESKSGALCSVLGDLLKLWHPFMPFVTETIWQNWRDKNWLMIEKWPQFKKTAALKAGREFSLIINIIKAIRNARAENRIEPTKKIKAVIYAGRQTKLIRSQAHLIKGLRTGLEELEIKERGEKLKEAIYAAAGGTEIYLLGAIDEGKERERLQKEIEKLKKLIAGLETKLKNKEFILKAPAAIVQAEKEKLESWKREEKKLGDRLEV